MTECVKPLSDLVTLSAKSSKWTALNGRAGQLSTLSLLVAEWFDTLCRIQRMTSLLENKGIPCRGDDYLTGPALQQRARGEGTEHQGLTQVR